MKRKHSFKAPFVTTFAAAAAIVACGGHVASDGSNATNPSADCPKTAPAVGDPCPPDFTASCSYADGSACGLSLQCADGKFYNTGSICNPPAQDYACPSTEPVVGTSCTHYGPACAYEDGCRPGERDLATCVNSAWSVTAQTYQVDCPTTMPQSGAPCGPCAAHYPSSCGYGDCQGQKNIFATCNPKTESWDVTGASCNPPAVVDAGTGDAADGGAIDAADGG